MFCREEKEPLRSTEMKKRSGCEDSTEPDYISPAAVMPATALSSRVWNSMPSGLPLTRILPSAAAGSQYLLHGGEGGLSSQCGNRGSSLHLFGSGSIHVGRALTTQFKAGNLVLFVGHEFRELHRVIHILGVGVHANQLEASEGSHLHLLARDGVGGFRPTLPEQPSRSRYRTRRR